MTFWKPLFLSGISEITKVCRVVLYWIIYYLHHFSALLRYNWQVKIYIWIIQLDVLVYKHCEIIPTIKLISMSITSNSYYFLWWEYLRSIFLAGGASGKEPACQCRRHKRCRFSPCVRMILWRRNGNALKYSCLENPVDRGTWQATVHRMAKNQTWLKWLSTAQIFLRKFQVYNTVLLIFTVVTMLYLRSPEFAHLISKSL